MEANLQARLNEGIRTLQALVGESAVINLIGYPCIVGIESIQSDLTEGGYKDVAHVNISINLQDINCSPVPPAIGNPVYLPQRNRNYRLNGITPTQTTWELELTSITY